MSISNQGPEGMILGGRYRISRLIGSGGMANVYLATDMSSGIHVAIKILKPEFTADEEFIKRFDTEAKAASSLSHPNIVRVLGVGQEGEFRYMVQEYVDGITAKELITQNGHLDWRVAVPIAIQVGMALDNAHQNGIVHRDIKPHNILITKDRIAKVTDFGIARAATSNTITLTSGGALGSVHYFSPEQARGSMVGPSTDIYSLGVLLFEMVTGRVPFDGDTSVAIAIKHLQEPPPLASGFVPGIPAGLDAIIQKAMQKSVDFRYPTIHEMIMEMDALMVDPNGAYGILVKSDMLDSSTNQMQAMRHDPNYGKLRDIEHSIEKRRRSRTKDNVLVILLVTVILGILLSTVYLVTKVVFGNLSKSSSTTFKIENYVGSPIQEVVTGFEKQKFTEYVITYEASTEYAKDIVFWQSIDAGVEIKPDNGLHKLELKVAAEQDTITIGEYSGSDPATVQTEILKLGLTFTTQNEASSTIEKGKVIGTTPPAGSPVKKDSEVVIIISDGVSTVTVPELNGVTLTKAKQILTDSDLILGTVQVNPGAMALPEDQQIVLYSDPAKATPVSPQSAITLYVGTYEDALNYKFQITPTPTPTPTPIPVTYVLTIAGANGGVAVGGGPYVEGKSVTVIATANDGYTFQNWVDDTGATFNGTSITFNMPSRNVTLTPVFMANATPTPVMNQLTVSVSPDGGGDIKNPNPNGAYAFNAVITVEAKESQGYTFVKWTDMTLQAIYGTDKVLIFHMPEKPFTLVALFAQITPTPSPASSVTPSVTPSITISPTPFLEPLPSPASTPMPSQTYMPKAPFADAAAIPDYTVTFLSDPPQGELTDIRKALPGGHRPISSSPPVTDWISLPVTLL